LPFAFGKRKKIGCSAIGGMRCFTTLNRILREREVYINPENEWKILYNLPAEARAKGEGEAEPTMWLRVLDKIRTFFRENPHTDF